MEIDNCYANASCTDTIGSFECACNNGFEGNGFSCTSKNVQSPYVTVLEIYLGLIAAHDLMTPIFTCRY